MSTVNNPKKRTQSDVRAEDEEAKSQIVAKVLSIVTAHGGGWLDARDDSALQQTCRAAKKDWCSDEGVWKLLALRTWPHLVKEGEGGRRPQVAGEEIESYQSLFCDPRLWLEVSAAQVKLLPGWSEVVHGNGGSGIECGRCGCNCNDASCPGVPIESEFRWEKKEKVGWPDNREDVPSGEGYEMSGGIMICVNRFCEPCFERLVELDVIKRGDYKKIPGKTLFDIVTKEMINATSERCNGPPFFENGEEWSWQELNKNVKADDVAIVVSRALIQEGCKTKYLQLDGIHYGDPGFGPLGYKALAYALALNKTVHRIDFFQGWDEGGCNCCFNSDTLKISYAADKSKGMFLKALKHNKDSKLKYLPLLCASAFGPKTWASWKTVKPNLTCGPGLENLEDYCDWEQYVKMYDEEEGEYDEEEGEYDEEEGDYDEDVDDDDEAEGDY